MMIQAHLVQGYDEIEENRGGSSFRVDEVFKASEGSVRATVAQGLLKIIR